MEPHKFERKSFFEVVLCPPLDEDREDSRAVQVPHSECGSSHDAEVRRESQSVAAGTTTSSADYENVSEPSCAYPESNDDDSTAGAKDVAGIFIHRFRLNVEGSTHNKRRGRAPPRPRAYPHNRASVGRIDMEPEMVDWVKQRAIDARKNALKRYRRMKAKEEARWKGKERSGDFAEGNSKRVEGGTQVPEQHNSPTEICVMCGKVLERNPQQVRRHYLTHLPDAYFCPICGKTYARGDSFTNRHFGGNSGCIDGVEAQRFRFPLYQYKLQYFDLYYLGAMEDYDIPDEVFELVARRKRDAGELPGVSIDSSVESAQTSAG